MTLSNDRLRKIHGIAEPTGPTDQAVLSRRKYHEAAAKWLAKRSVLLQAVFVTIGFVVVLLPMFSKTLRAIIESTPIIRNVFHDYSTFSGLAMVNLYVLMMLFLFRSWHIKSFPGGGSLPPDLQKCCGNGALSKNKKRRISLLG